MKPVKYLSALLLSAAATVNAEESRINNEDDKLYGNRLTLVGYYQNDTSSFTQADVLIPILQNQNAMLFFDGRALAQQEGVFGGNLGLGYRQLTSNYEQLFGLYSFFDQTTTSLGNQFQQVTVGGEFKMANWQLWSNGYIPVGETTVMTPSLNQSYLTSAANNFNNIVYEYGMEKVLPGFDGMIAFLPPALPELRIAGGGYYFAADGAPTISGPRGQFSYQIPGLFGWDIKAVDHVMLDSFIQYDDVRGTQYGAGIRIAFQMGGKKSKSLSGMQKHMLDYIERSITPVTETAATSGRLTNSDGSLTTVAIVNNQSDQQQIETAFSQADIVAVQGTIENLANVQLRSGNTNQQLITGNSSYLYTVNGTTFRAPLASSNNNAHLVAAPNNNLLIVGQNNTIENISLTVDPSGSYLAIKNQYDPMAINQIGNSVGNLVINNTVIYNGGIGIKIGDGSRDSMITISNNHITIPTISNNMPGNSASDNALGTGIDIEVNNYSSNNPLPNTIVNATVLSNTIILGATPDTTPTLKANGINNFAGANSVLNYIDAGLNNNRIYIGAITNETSYGNINGISNAVNQGTINFSNISNNQIFIGSIGANINSVIKGIYNSSYAGIICFNQFENNQVNLIGDIAGENFFGGNTVAGIYNITNSNLADASITFSSFNNNTINFNGNLNTTRQIYGIASQASDSFASETNPIMLTYNSFKDNKVNLASSDNSFKYYFASNDATDPIIAVNINDGTKNFAEANGAAPTLGNGGQYVIFNPPNPTDNEN